MGIGNWWSSVVKGATDAIGLTDTKAGERGFNTMQAGANTAQTSLKNNMQPVYDSARRQGYEVWPYDAI